MAFVGFTAPDPRRWAAQMMGQEMQISILQGMQDAVSSATQVESKMLKYIGDHFLRLAQFQPQRFTKAHTDVGLAAQRSMVQGFRNRRFRRPAGRYRAGENRLSGELGKALSNQGHVRANPYTLEFLNIHLMDQQAAHWRRLNFGAGGGSQEGITAPQQFPINWNGLVVATLGLDSQPSPAFRIPRGFWLTPSGESAGGANPSRLGQDQFFLRGQRIGRSAGRPSKSVVTAGIASRNFLDAGVRRVANELPRAYETIYTEAWTDMKPVLQALAGTARVPRPGPQRIKRFYR